MKNREYSDYVIFVDESGDHNLQNVAPDYPVFVLDFCIFRKTDYANQIVPKIQEFKFEHFGHDIVVLHEHSIRKQKKPFLFLTDQAKRNNFLNGLSQLIEEVEFTIIATVIRKEQQAKAYANPTSPYDLALKFCMERAYYFLVKQQQNKLITHIVVERRGRTEDNNLELTFRRICDGETEQAII